MALTMRSKFVLWENTKQKMTQVKLEGPSGEVTEISAATFMFLVVVGTRNKTVGSWTQAKDRE
jgi:hypothetical protein